MTKITVAALQLALGSTDEQENIAAVSALVEEAAGKGARIVLPPELFSSPYFCKIEDDALFATARPVAEHPSVTAMRELARMLKVAIPTSFFERDGHHYYNTLAMIGHAVSNCMPVIAANRIGQENECGGDGQHFYGHSFISDEWGDLIEQYGAEETGALVATLDLTAAAKHRASWGFFRDRRPQLYGRICEDV